MAYTTLFQTVFDGGDFDSASFAGNVYGSTDQGGGGLTFNDPPLTGNEKIWWIENGKRVESAGPNGENVFDCSDAGDPVITSLGLVPGEIGTRKEFDMRPTVDGPFTIEWDQFFSQTYWDLNGQYAQLFWIGSDNNHGSSQSGVIFGEDVVFIEMFGTSGYAFEWGTEHYEPHATLNGFVSPDNFGLTPTFSIDNQWRTMKLVVVPGTTTGAPDGLGGKGTLSVSSDGSIRLYSKLSSEPASAYVLEFELVNKPIVINRNDSTADGVNYGKGINFANPTTVGAVTNIHVYWGTLEEEEEFVGSFSAGVNTDVVVDRGVAFGLDGGTHIHDEEGTLAVWGDVAFHTLPTSDPGVAGQLWNDAGVLKISAG